VIDDYDDTPDDLLDLIGEIVITDFDPLSGEVAVNGETYRWADHEGEVLVETTSVSDAYDLSGEMEELVAEEIDRFICNGGRQQCLKNVTKCAR